MNLKQEDTAFAMHEVGLLVRTVLKEESDGQVTEKLVFTKELIEKIAKLREVKPPCLGLEFVQL